MEIRRSLVVPSDAERLYSWVEDLSIYPQWMKLVHEVHVDDEVPNGGAWHVELRAQVGPFARSKSLRMVRTEHDAPHSVTFEREERDGRSHAPWVLRAMLQPRPVVADQPAGIASTDLSMELRYGGGLWSGVVLQRVLDDAVRRASDELIDVVRHEPTH
jgi:hypothetical protein